MKDDDRIGLLWLIFILAASIICIVLLVFDGCKIEPIYEFDEIPELGIQSVEDAMLWVASEVNYVPDSIHYPADEYWQSPAQTYVWKSGDCEDYSILALYLVHRDVDIDGMMWLNHDHAWVFVDGHEWEPQLGMIADGWYEVVKKLRYDDVIRRATTSHKSLTKAEK